MNRGSWIRVWLKEGGCTETIIYNIGNIQTFMTANNYILSDIERIEFNLYKEKNCG